MKTAGSVMLAGVLLAAAFVLTGGPGAAAADGPAATTQPAGERVYGYEQLMRVDTVAYNSEFVWDGPTSSARVYKLSGLAVDNDGNIYAAVRGVVGRGGHEGSLAYECVIFKYDPKTKRVTRLAGGARGAVRDGPGEIAQFDYQTYASGGLKIDRQRGYLYLADTVNQRARRIRIRDGYVTTVGPDIRTQSVAVDQTGVVYSLGYRGKEMGLYRLTPQGPAGEDAYTVERVGEYTGSLAWCLEADANRGKVYASSRGPDIHTVKVWDLKSAAAGEIVKPAPLAEPTVPVKTSIHPKCYMTDGPIEGAGFFCPNGLSRSPDGRYLYLGGGDEQTYRRIDVDKRRVASFFRLPDGRFTWKERRVSQSIYTGTRNSFWPSACCEGPDGTFYVGSASAGLIVHRPVDKP